MFARLLMIQKNSDIDMKKVLRYELSAAPLSLYDPNVTSTLCKTAKSKLFNHLKKLVPTAATIPPKIPKIFDGMVLFQKLPPTLKTFGYISDYILNKIRKGDTLAFVTDYYLENSIKSLERKGRSNFVY